MQVSSINFGGVYFTNKSSIVSSNKSYQLKQDRFERNTNISFGNQTVKTKNAKWEKFTDGLAVAGFVGCPFLISLGLSSALAKLQNPEDIFLSDGTYLGNVNDMSFKTNNVHVDGDDGIFQVKSLGIDINPNRFDIVDPQKGIYKNFENGVDINLLENKYIDPENGIFIDPDNGISAVLNAQGKLQNITLPDFSFGNAMPHWAYKYAGSGSSSTEYYTRAEFIENYGTTPENYTDLHDGSTVGKEIFIDNKIIKIIPDDNRSLSEKIVDFLVPGPDVKYDWRKTYDVFGREIISFKDGNVYREVPMNDDMREIIEKYDLNQEKITELVKFVDNIKLKQYIESEYPDYNNLVPSGINSIEEFIEQIGLNDEISTNGDYGTDIDADPDTPDIDTDNFDSDVDIDTDNFDSDVDIDTDNFDSDVDIDIDDSLTDGLEDAPSGLQELIQKIKDMF